MAQKKVFNTAEQFQQNVGSENLDLSQMPLVLASSTPLELVDDFNDGVKDTRWQTSGILSKVHAYDQGVSIQTRGFYTASRYMAQTFELPAQYAVAKVEMVVFRDNYALPGDIILEIRATTGSPGSETPTSTVLATSNPIPAASLPLFQYPNPVFVAFAIQNPPVLQPGVRYALVLRHTQIHASYKAYLASDDYITGDRYATGRGLYSDDSGATWSPFTSYVRDFWFRIYAPGDNPKPAESGGLLAFDYPSRNTAEDIETIFNSGRGALELETRFIWTRLDTAADTGMTWGIAWLRGEIKRPPLTSQEYEDRLLVEIRIQTWPQSNDLTFVVVMVGVDGTKYAWKQSYTWETFTQGFIGFPILPWGSAAGVPVTIKITPQENGGVKVKIYKNDDPGQTILDTLTASPAVRTLTGNRHLSIGHYGQIYGSRVAFDYFKLSGQPQQAAQGHVVLRHQYMTAMKFQRFTLDRVLPSQANRVNVYLRAGNTVEDVQAQPWGTAAPTTAQGDIETGEVAAAAAMIFETKLEFIGGSSPSLNGFDFTSQVAAAADDAPIVLSLDAANGWSYVVSSEEATQSANTAKAVDGDAATQWASLGNAQDGQQATLHMQFRDANGVAKTERVGSVILRNHNLRELDVLSHTDAVLFSGEVTEDDEIIVFDEVDTQGIKIRGKSTRPANQNKKIGEVYAGRILVVMPPMDEYEPVKRVFEAGDLRTLGGRLISFAGVAKYAARLRWALVEQATKDALAQVFTAIRQVTLWPEPVARPRDLFDVGWKSDDLPHPYTDKHKDAGLTIEVSVEEI
ncbi:MAG: hypothetical protein WC728_03755 [Elusimicrobiota bacterium]